MPPLNPNVLTLVETTKRLDPNGQVALIAELLTETNEILLDMPWSEGNLTVGHRTTIRTGLPDVYWRSLNQGVPSSKSRTAQVDETCGMLEAWSEVDKDLAELGGNVAAVRLSEARAFLEAMNQELASTLFYGNASLSPQEFTGFSVRYGDLTAQNAQNIVLPAAAPVPPTPLTSIWLVAWGEQTVAGIYPKGSKAGLIHEDFGLETAETTSGLGGSRMRVYRDRYQWKAGLCVKDWRYVVRIPNVDVTALSGANPPDLIDLMEHASVLLPNELGRRVFYCNRTILRHLRRQVRAAVQTGGGLTFENWAGKRVLMFGDIPIRRTDALVNTEALVV